MQDQEIGFDDWEKQAQLITIESVPKQQQQVRKDEPESKQPEDSPPVIIDPYQRHLKQIERIKKLTSAQFQEEFSIKSDNMKTIEPVNVLLKAQKEFNDLAKNVGQHFKNVARNLPEKNLGESQILTFFEQFLLYLYPNIEWESIESVKEKIKILKKDKKQEELKVKKLKEKQQRLKRAYGKQQTPSKQTQNPKKQENIGCLAKMEQENM